MKKSIHILSLLCILSIQLPATFAQDSNKYFTLRIVDQKTGRGVPLVELKTNNKISYYKEGMKRSERLICRVWKNPSSVLTLDYKAKPVQMNN